MPTLVGMRFFHFCFFITLCVFYITPRTASVPNSNATRDSNPSSLLSGVGGQRREDERQYIRIIPKSIPQTARQSQNLTAPMQFNSTDAPPGFVPNSPVTYEQVDCCNLRSGRDNKCWDELRLNEYVRWWTENNRCRQDEPFAACFLRKEGFYALDCTGIKPDACTPPQSDSLQVEPHVFYVAYNIYGLLLHCSITRVLLR